MLVFKDRSRRSYNVATRDYLGTNALERQTVKNHFKSIIQALGMYRKCHSKKVKQLVRLVA